MRAAAIGHRNTRVTMSQQHVQPDPNKCHYWVERKGRYCRWPQMKGSKYCGNHFNCESGEGPKRIVCPYDPTGGHTVLESELEKHKAKCPAYKLRLAEQAQPCFKEGVNEGPGPEVTLPEASSEFADGKGRTDTPSVRRAAYAAGLGQEGFARLLARIGHAYEQLCAAPEPVSVLSPPEAAPYLQPDNIRPFSLKHATQQASIVGNMQAAGLLEAAPRTTYVEFGAGKGYLSCMLADCSAARSFVMMDMRSFKQKADRSMRHLDIQRLRCDIKDFDAGGVRGLEGAATPWVAIGKHLCGVATDFTLRCAARERSVGDAASAAEEQQQGQRGEQQEGQEGQGKQVEEQAAAAAVVAAAPAAEAVAVAKERGRGGGLRGLAVATCCHHRCSWRHYVGQEVFLAAGFSPEEFELISWMTGWALCGHEAPAGFGGSEEGCSDAEEGESAGPAGAAQKKGAAAAVEGAQRLEAGGPEGGSASTSDGQGPAKRQHLDDEAQGPVQQPSPAVAAASGAAAGAAEGGGQVGGEEREAEEEGQEQQKGPWRPYHSLTRAQRIAVGQKCKRLIDTGRLLWLQRQGFLDTRLVAYVPPEVSGENRLLLARAT